MAALAAPAEQDAAPAWSLDEIPQAIQDPGFQALAPEQRAGALEEMLQSAHGHALTLPGFTPDQHKDFGDVADELRQQVAPSLWEKTKGYLAAPFTGLADMAKAAWFAGADALPAGVDDFKVPLSTTAQMALPQAAKLANSLNTTVADTFSPQAKNLYAHLDGLKQQMDAGQLPRDEQGMKDWLRNNAADTAGLQAEYYAAKGANGNTPRTQAQAMADDGTPSDETYNYAIQNSLASPDNARLLGQYAATRNPHAWQQLVKNLTIDPQRAALEAQQRDVLNHSETMRGFKSAGINMEDAARLAGDPVMAGAMIAGGGLGAEALAGKSSLAKLGIGAGEAVGLGAGSLYANDPHATFQEHLDTAGHMLAMSLGLAGLGKAGHAALERWRGPAAAPAPAADAVPQVDVSGDHPFAPETSDFRPPDEGASPAEPGAVPEAAAAPVEPSVAGLKGNTAESFRALAGKGSEVDTPEQLRVAQGFNNDVAHDVNGYVDRYIERFGNVVDTDRARELAPEYAASREGRQEHSRGTSHTASALAQKVYDRLVDTAPPGEVVFNAGGPGSGKSTLLSEATRRRAAIVYDTVMADPKRAVRQIDQALDKGHPVTINYIHQPLEAAVRNTIDRAANPDNGRIVEAYAAARAHKSAQDAIFKVAEHYAQDPRVKINVVDNTNFAQRPSSLQELHQARYTEPLADLEKRATLAAQQHLDERQATHPADYTDELRAGVLRPSRGADASGAPGARAEGQRGFQSGQGPAGSAGTGSQGGSEAVAAKRLGDPGSELGLGGTKKQRTSSPDTPSPSTPEEVKQTVTDYTPGSAPTKAGMINSLLQPFAPGARSQGHLRAAESLGAALGTMHRSAEQAAHAMDKYGRAFDKLGVERPGLAPQDNAGSLFASALSTGAEMKGWMAEAARAVKHQFDARLEKLKNLGVGLETVRDNYFPGMWTKDSRDAFNAVIHEAVAAKVIPEGFDLNAANPEQRAWVKQRVDKALADGVGSDKDALGYLTRTPLKGKESFRKGKVFDDIMTAQEFGLKPVSNNPITLVKLKLAEMDRSIMANQFLNEQKARGRMKVITPSEQVPEGWAKVQDKYGTIYGKPTVDFNEWVDKAVYDGLNKVAQGLGITHERETAIGGRRLGYSVTGGNHIVTKAGTETSVLAHEIGHQIDEKYNLWDYLHNGGNKGAIGKQLRNIADLTGRGEYARKAEEKMAQVVEAYVHAPDKMRAVAPDVFAKFHELVMSRPELRGLADIQPGLELKRLKSEQYVGLVTTGFRIVPKEVGDVMNNYLSSSLYNNPIFGGLYKGWMNAAAVLNQAQLGMGSAFHVGFTAADVQTSAIAHVFKDAYGVLSGESGLGDVAGSLHRGAVALVRNPIIGDRVLNAWRDPNGRIDPRIEQVVKAAELAGGAFQLEAGLATKQIPQMVSDWHSGMKVRAALRSPIAAVELMAKPIMEWLVPRQKAGVFAELASRIIDRNPGKSMEELRPQFRQAWNRVDARLGQVAYDRVFMNNMAKNLIQAGVRAPGWTGGTIAELGGAWKDMAGFLKEWHQTGRLPRELPDRVAYTLALLGSTFAINGALTYAFTGQKPQGTDWFAFRDGGKDAHGNPTRLVLPTYMKDILSYAKDARGTLANKTHPLISLGHELNKNQDYYGTEIRHPDDNPLIQAGQVGKYVAKQFVPFWLRGAQKQSDEGKGLSSQVAAYFGIMPAPRHMVQTPAEALAAEISQGKRPVGGRTQAQADRSDVRSQIALGKLDPRQALARGLVTPADVQHIRAQSGLAPLQRTLAGFSAEDATRVYEKANDDEKLQIRPLVKGKIGRSTTLTLPQKRELMQRVR